jgi:hypothetical protein
MAHGNFVSEWFGHRMYPAVVSTPDSLADQRNQRCPFLSAATGQVTECIKSKAAKGVCTISSVSNGPRQDWVVCPYRAFDLPLMQDVARRLYETDATLHLFPAPVLRSSERQALVRELLAAGERVLVYFDQKMGGEIQVGATDRSPQIAFDTTFVELLVDRDAVRLGRFAVLEIQTMDFHGSYRKAVDNLESALRLHLAEFPGQVQANQRWLSEKVEGPNIANVFKRTFWQMMFKFEMAATPSCAGVALAVPAAVWDSWQKFLAAPPLVDQADGTVRLDRPRDVDAERLASWIYVFDLDADASVSPSPMQVRRIIHTSAGALAHYALEEAPKGAIVELQGGIYRALRRRFREFWPLDVEIPAGGGGSAVRVAEDPRPVDRIEADPGN